MSRGRSATLHSSARPGDSGHAPITVPAIELPIVGGIGTHVVRARRTEVVDPYRAMQPSASFNDRNTPCRG